MKLRIILVVASCLLSVVIGIVLSQQRLSRDLDRRIADQVSRELDRRKADVASIQPGSTTGATVAPRAGKKLVIGLSMDTLQEERWKGDRDMFVACAKELGADVEVLDANSDDTRQIQQVKSFSRKTSTHWLSFPTTAR
jgi:hypothetical protein